MCPVRANIDVCVQNSRTPYCILTPAGQCANQNKNHWCGQTTISLPVCHHSCLQAVSIQRKGCQKVTGCSVSFHKSKKILILLFWGDNPFTFFTFKPRVLQMQWSFLVIYAKTIFCNISLANKTTSPIQKEDTRLISGAAMTCWLTPYQKWSIANTNTYTNPIPIPIPNQVQPWRAGAHHLRDGALHHQDRHRRWFLPGVMLLMMFMVMVFRNF